MATLERNKIWVNLGEIDIDGDTLDAAIKRLQDAKKTHSAAFPDGLRLDKQTRRWDDGQDIHLQGLRLENDAELAKRQATEDKRVEFRRKEFDKMKREFGE